MATSLNNLAELYRHPRPVRAGRAALQALAGDQGEGPRPGSSRCGHEPEQPRGAVQHPRPVRAGRAALQALAGDQGEGPRPGSSRCGREPEQPRGAVRRPRPVRAGRAALQALAGDRGEGPRPGSSRCGHEPEQPRDAVRHPRPVRAGRAALQALAGDQEKALGPDHPDVATSLNNLAALYTPKASTRRPSRSTSARWRSRRRPSARIIPMWPRA